MPTYPFGIDTAFGNLISAGMATNLDFAIPRIGTLGYSGIGTSAYFSKSLSVDSVFVLNVNNCQNTGKPTGCYIFSYAWNDASAIYEADKCCDALDSLGMSLELPVWFDWEYDSDERTTAAGVPVSNSALQSLTLAFMARVNERGRTAGWYANMDYVQNKYGANWTTARMAENYYFWVAAWGGGDTPPRTCDIWQYAGDVTWSGIDVDLNWLVDPRCVNGNIGHRFPKWLIAKIIKDRRKQCKSFRKV